MEVWICFEACISYRSGIKLYPNPAHNDLTLQSAVLNATVQMRIHDMSGRVWQQQTLQFADGKTSVHLEEPPGIYAIQLTDIVGNITTEKLLIE